MGTKSGERVWQGADRTGLEEGKRGVLKGDSKKNREEGVKEG